MLRKDRSQKDQRGQTTLAVVDPEYWRGNPSPLEVNKQLTVYATS